MNHKENEDLVALIEAYDKKYGVVERVSRNKKGEYNVFVKIMDTSNKKSAPIRDSQKTISNTK